MQRKMHIAVIPDGNRRYMQKKGILNLKKSYQSGINKFYDFLEWSKEMGAKEITIYALSTENIRNREKREINTLLELFASQALKVLEEGRLHRNKVKVNLCGDLNYLFEKISEKKLREKVKTSFEKLEQETKMHKGLVLNLAVAYGGRKEILHALEEMCKEKVPFTEEKLKQHLWVKSYPDLIIRTSETRLSNFLLFQGAYSEIYFVPKLWQEFEREDLEKIVEDFSEKERRFGR